VPDIPRVSRLFCEDTVLIYAQHTGYNVALQHNQNVMQMNGIPQCTSARVQRVPSSVVGTIDEPGCSAGLLGITFEQETTMLKTMSAALLAMSVLAVPALAAQSSATTANAPLVKATQGKSVESKTQVSTPPSIQATTTQARPGALNANAKMGKRLHRKHLSIHHRHHGKLAAMKTSSSLHAMPKATLKTAPKISQKPVAATSRRG
jgi:hypothetical protein